MSAAFHLATHGMMDDAVLPNHNSQQRQQRHPLWIDVQCELAIVRARMTNIGIFHLFDYTSFRFKENQLIRAKSLIHYYSRSDASSHQGKTVLAAQRRLVTMRKGL
jgi:hypothetical protein